MYNNVGASLENAGAQLTNNGTLTNSGSLWNKRYLPPVVGATTELIPTLTNNGTLDNIGTLTNDGTLDNSGTLTTSTAARWTTTAR